jgi:hypothetical protein
MPLFSGFVTKSDPFSLISVLTLLFLQDFLSLLPTSLFLVGDHARSPFLCMFPAPLFRRPPFSAGYAPFTRLPFFYGYFPYSSPSSLCWLHPILFPGPPLSAPMRPYFQVLPSLCSQTPLFPGPSLSLRLKSLFPGHPLSLLPTSLFPGPPLSAPYTPVPRPPPFLCFLCPCSQTPTMSAYLIQNLKLQIRVIIDIKRVAPPCHRPWTPLA